MPRLQGRRVLSGGDRGHLGPGTWTQPLRLHLSVIVGALVIAVSCALIGLNYLRGRQAALEYATREMRIYADRIVDRYRVVFGSAALLVEVASGSRMVRRPEEEDQATLGRFLQQILGSSEYIDSAYVGYPSGAFVDAVSIKNNPLWRTVLKAPTGAAFATRIIAIDDEGRHLSRWEFLDADGHWLATSDAEPTDYDPRERAWYRSAARAPGLITTAPYSFATNKAFGITLARRHSVYGSIVIGVDILVGTLNAFLSSQLITPRAKVFIFDAQNQIVASSDQCTGDCARASRDQPLMDRIRSIVGQHAHGDNGELIVSRDGREYLVVVSSISSTPVIEGGSIVSLAPMRDLTAASDHLLRQGLLISVGVLAIGVAGAFLMARQISRSLAALTGQAHRLMRFELGATERISSRITEIWLLGGAISAAANAIATFGLYVPTDLVRRIIRSGEFTGRSGQKHSVTALFSDIANFTTICERYPAEEVATSLSDYFDLASEVVRRHRGVILQFAGDSVFALWNAPEEDELHVDRACSCALDLDASIREFNSNQIQRGAPEFATRFGVHTGIVVVGVVGARDRLQYTAMGDVINVASRLEGLNKALKTTILVSAAVVAGAKGEFCFTSFGLKQVKGRGEAVEVFELRAAARPALTSAERNNQHTPTRLQSAGSDRPESDPPRHSR
jgi:adenylate cyclase